MDKIKSVAKTIVGLILLAKQWVDEKLSETFSFYKKHKAVRTIFWIWAVLNLVFRPDLFLGYAMVLTALCAIIKAASKKEKGEDSDK